MRKYVPIIIVVLAIVVVFVGDKVLSNDPAPEVSGDDPSTVVAEAANTALAEPIEGSISKGTPFFVAMQRAGVSPVDIDGIVRASKSNFNFRKVQPGQKYSIFEGAEGRLDSMHFAVDSERVLKISRASEGFVTRVDTIPYEVEHYMTSGTINNSIFATLQAKGANPELASYLAMIYQWDIDFFKDIRKGDTFSILYEQRVYPNGKSQLGNVLAARVRTQGREHYAIAYRNKKGDFAYYDTRGRSLQKSLLRAPLRYSRISSNFTYKRLHPVTHTYKAHLGVDYVAPIGTPVRSTGTGTVVAATYNRANGNYVKIRHNSRYETYYLHLKGFAKGIRSGKRVTQGQVIGYLGATGLVNGAHLDYRIKVGGKFVNPRRVKLPSKQPVPSGEQPLFEVVRDSFLLRFFEANMEGETVLVRRPAPPLQTRMDVAF